MGGNNKFKRTVFEYMERSFIAIMPVGRKHVNMNFGLENAINQSMFFRDLTTPTIFRVPFKRLRMPRACHRMLCYFIQKPNSLLKVSRLTAFKLGKSFFSFRSKGYSIHLQSELSHTFISFRLVKVIPLPSAISFSALSIRARNSSSVSSVGSPCFSATSLRKYLVARLSRLSSSAMMLMLRSNSAFRCKELITLIY